MVTCCEWITNVIMVLDACNFMRFLFLYFVSHCLLMSLFPSWNREFSKDREFGREVSSVGDVSSMKSKIVCAFHCLNLPFFFCGLLCAIYIFGSFNQKFGQKPEACKRTLIAVDNPIYCFGVLNYSSLWQLNDLACFIKWYSGWSWNGWGSNAHV